MGGGGERYVERKIESGGGGGWVLHCYGTFLIPCECRIYLVHHSFLIKRKKRKAMIWAEMRRGEAS